ncbi:SCO6880 family protein [Paenarthrobacter sp. NPDC089675]|uniref:SCO6880 family protein n=1 Tax=Paenarthrobacter TaxID=1742992 RepID=UPI00380F40F8
MAAISTEYKEPSYGNWRVPRSAGLANLGAIGTAIVFAGLLAGIVSFAIWGLFVGLGVLAFAGVSALLLTVKDKHGQSIIDRGGTRIAFKISRSSGTNLYRSGPLGVTPWGMYQLPGLAAKSTLYEFTDSYKRPFAMLHVPTTSHYTVIFSTEPDGASLVDPEQVDAWVANWGGWLAALADEAGLDSAAVTVETAPDSGYRLRNEVLMNIAPDAPAFAREMLHEVVETYPEGSATVRAWVSLTFNAAIRTGAKKRTPEEVARDLASRIPGLSARLQSTGAGIARPMTAQELCEVVRIAYDPPAALIIDEAHAAGSPVSLTWGEVGPTAHQANWEHYRHDSAFSASWSMTGAPRGSVNSSVLSRLLAPHGDVDRKRVSLLYRPMDSARAAAVVERDQNNANVRITSGTRPSARALVDARSAAQTAQEEAQGAGLVNFGMVITATVTDRERLSDAVAAVEQSSGSARLLLRKAHGSQDTAFAASLPLGLVLPEHSMLPSEIKDAL